MNNAKKNWKLKKKKINHWRVPNVYIRASI